MGNNKWSWIQVVEWLWLWWHLHAVYLLFFTCCFGLHGIMTFFVTTVLHCWISIKTYFHSPCVLMMIKAYTNLHFFQISNCDLKLNETLIKSEIKLNDFLLQLHKPYIYVSWCDLLYNVWKMNTLCHKKCIRS